MKKSKFKIVLEDYKNNFTYKKNTTNVDIQFNRIAFIFFLFFIIYLIYIIHLIHLGSRKSSIERNDNIPILDNKLYRADIVDINGNYLAKTVMAGNVYSTSVLPIVPNYNFQWLTNGKKRIIFREGRLRGVGTVD